MKPVSPALPVAPCLPSTVHVLPRSVWLRLVYLPMGHGVLEQIPNARLSGGAGVLMEYFRI